MRLVLVVLVTLVACGFPRPNDVAFDASVGDTQPDASQLLIADWVARHGGPGDDRGVAIAAAPNGDLVMTGTFTGTMTLGGPTITSAGNTNVWVARYRADGTHLWSLRLGDTSDGHSTGVAVDGKGDVYVVGFFIGPVNFGGGVRSDTIGQFLVKLLGTDGTYQWDRVFRGASVDGLAVLDANHIATCGIFSGTVDFGGGGRTSTPSNGFDNFVAAYSTASGAHVWSQALTTSGDDGDPCSLVGVGGDVVVTGGFIGTAMLGGAPLMAHGSEDMYVVRYRGTDGAHVWSIRQGGTDQALPRVIATDGTHLFVGGMFGGTTNLGGSDLIAVDGTFDAFVASYNASDGSHAWSEGFGGANADVTTSIAASSTKLAVAIYFAVDTIAIGTRTFTTKNADVAIARLNPSTGAPSSAATQFGSSATSTPNNLVTNTMALVYTSDRLAGVGTFSESTDLLGTNLFSVGGNDVASFRVDF